MDHAAFDDRVRRSLPSRLAGGLFFGGSFDPPHLGHARLPDAVFERLGYESEDLVYAPAARSPHKSGAPTPPHHRVAMLRLVLPRGRNSWIWTEELDRAVSEPGEPSYWAKTWTKVIDSCTGDRPRFLIGADQAVSMHRWFSYETIWRDAVVMLRDDQDDAGRLIGTMEQTEAWSADELEQWRSMIVRVPMIDASSTRVREALRAPATRENPIAGLDDRVHSYILEHGLYTG